MKTLKLLVAVALPLALIAGSANAAPPATGLKTGAAALAAKKAGNKRAAPSFGRIGKILGKEAKDKLLSLRGAVGACFKQHGKVKGKEACRDQRRSFVRTQTQFYKDAAAKATGKDKEILTKKSNWLEKRRAHLKAKAAAKGGK